MAGTPLALGRRPAPDGVRRPLISAPWATRCDAGTQNKACLSEKERVHGL